MLFRSVAVASAGCAVEALILTAFASHGPMTDDDLCRRLWEQHRPTVKTARSRLAHRGDLHATGAHRLSDRGKPMIVWTLTVRGAA